MVQCSVQPSRYKRRKKEEHVHRRTRNTEVERGSKRAEGFYFPQLILGNLQYLETWSVVLDNRKTAILLSFLQSSYLALLVRIKPASHKVPPTGLQLIQLQPRQLPLSCDQPTPFTIPWFPLSSPPMCLVYDDRDRADDLSCTVTPCRRSVGQIREYRSWILWKYLLFIQIPICQDYSLDIPHIIFVSRQ